MTRPFGEIAGSVAALGAVGTISSVDLRRHHPDLMHRTRGTGAVGAEVANGLAKPKLADLRSALLGSGRRRMTVILLERITHRT